MKICIATGTRAEYGLLKPLISAVSSEAGWQLQLMVTGAHLSPEFGLTYKTIEEDGFKIDRKVEMLLSGDTPTAVVKSMGLAMIGYADALEDLKPDFLIILGDRYEMLSVASAALIFNIPIGHIHGGEITEGAYDDAIRHSLTKMSHLHFTSTEEYRYRVIQMGENPDAVFNVGAIGLDNVRSLKLLTREELEENLSIRFKKYNYQVTFHPSTLDTEAPAKQFQILLDCIKKQKDSFFIFTKANADTGGRIINRMIDDFVNENPASAVAFTSLGNLRFLSVVKECTAIVGNSSSGILEAPSLHTATINIGDRQKGRIQAQTVINTSVNKKEILAAFKEVKDLNFKKKVESSVNPYGNGLATEQIMESLRTIDLMKLKSKRFYNLQ